MEGFKIDIHDIREAGRDIDTTVRKAGGDVSRETKKAGGDVSREFHKGKDRLAGDIQRDILREEKYVDPGRLEQFGQEYKGSKIIYVNGICNDPEMARYDAKQLSEKLKRPVELLYNPDTTHQGGVSGKLQDGVNALSGSEESVAAHAVSGVVQVGQNITGRAVGTAGLHGVGSQTDNKLMHLLRSRAAAGETDIQVVAHSDGNRHVNDAVAQLQRDGKQDLLGNVSWLGVGSPLTTDELHTGNLKNHAELARKEDIVSFFGGRVGLSEVDLLSGHPMGSYHNDIKGKLGVGEQVLVKGPQGRVGIPIASSDPTGGRVRDSADGGLNQPVEEVGHNVPPPGLTKPPNMPQPSRVPPPSAPSIPDVDIDPPTPDVPPPPGPTGTGPFTPETVESGGDIIEKIVDGIGDAFEAIGDGISSTADALKVLNPAKLPEVFDAGSPEPDVPEEAEGFASSSWRTQGREDADVDSFLERRLSGSGLDLVPDEIPTAEAIASETVEAAESAAGAGKSLFSNILGALD